MCIRDSPGTTGAPRLLLGLAGWSDRGFLGGLYPRGTPSGAYLERYARVFPTNELNSTYYGVSPERITRWAAAVPAGFRFCPKLPAAITHERGLRDAGGAMESFLDALAHFEGKLGLVWGILAPSFGPESLETLEAFLQDWAPRVPLALELRHPAWFADAAALDSALGCFERHGAVAVLTDVAGRRDVLHMRLTGRAAMLRFVGNALHPSDFQRLDEWVERTALWLERGLEAAYVFLHQKLDPQAVDLARHFADRFEERTGVQLLPRPTPERAPRQHELF